MFCSSGSTVCRVLLWRLPGSPSCLHKLQWKPWILTWELWQVGFAHPLNGLFVYILAYRNCHFFGGADDWLYERSSNVFFLGDPIAIEASVRVGHHMGLRVFISSCVATLDPDIYSVPRYIFIENGWALDMLKGTLDAKWYATLCKAFPAAEEHCGVWKKLPHVMLELVNAWSKE